MKTKSSRYCTDAIVMMAGQVKRGIQCRIYCRRPKQDEWLCFKLPLIKKPHA